MTKVVGPAGSGDGRRDGPGRSPPTPGLFEVECTTLDALAAGFESQRISLLKLDVEGHEPQVLAGAAGLLAAQAIDLVYVEAGMDPEGGQQSYYREIEDRLRGHGYRLFRIYEQMHEWQEDSPLLRRVNLAFMSSAFAQRHPFRLTLELAAVRRERDDLKTGLKAEKAARAEAETELARARAAAAATAARLERRVAELAAVTALAEQRQADRAGGRSRARGREGQPRRRHGRDAGARAARAAPSRARVRAAPTQPRRPRACAATGASSRPGTWRCSTARPGG